MVLWSQRYLQASHSLHVESCSVTIPLDMIRLQLPLAHATDIEDCEQGLNHDFPVGMPSSELRSPSRQQNIMGKLQETIALRTKCTQEGLALSLQHTLYSKGRACCDVGPLVPLPCTNDRDNV